MKQNTERLKKEFEEKFNTHIKLQDSGENRYGYVGKFFPTDLIWDFFLPHLISSDEKEIEEIKSDLRVLNIPVTVNTGQKLVNMISEYGIDVIADYLTKTTLPHDEIKREAVKSFVKSLDFWSLFADKENITSNDVEDYVAECLKETLEELIITQSKEGGE